MATSLLLYNADALKPDGVPSGQEASAADADRQARTEHARGKKRHAEQALHHELKTTQHTTHTRPHSAELRHDVAMASTSTAVPEDSAASSGSRAETPDTEHSESGPDEPPTVRNGTHPASPELHVPERTAPRGVHTSHDSRDADDVERRPDTMVRAQGANSQNWSVSQRPSSASSSGHSTPENTIITGKNSTPTRTVLTTTQQPSHTRFGHATGAELQHTTECKSTEKHMPAKVKPIRRGTAFTSVVEISDDEDEEEGPPRPTASAQKRPRTEPNTGTPSHTTTLLRVLRPFKPPPLVDYDGTCSSTPSSPHPS